MAKFNETQKYEAIIEVLNDSGLADVRGIPLSDLTDLCEKKIAQIANKAAATSSKVDPAKVAFRNDVLSALANLSAPSTVTEIMKQPPLCNIVGLQNQKVSRYLNDLVIDGLVIKVKNGKASLFSLA